MTLLFFSAIVKFPELLFLNLQNSTLEIHAPCILVSRFLQLFSKVIDIEDFIIALAVAKEVTLAGFIYEHME